MSEQAKRFVLQNFEKILENDERAKRAKGENYV